jgi:rhodanese-related sulfurtransferase
MLNVLKNLFSSKDLSKIINENTLLVDVRTATEFDSGSVKGAVNIPLDRVQNNIDKFKNKSNIIVFCRSGNRSSQAKNILNEMGINNVTNGGTWQNVAQFVK